MANWIWEAKESRIISVFLAQITEFMMIAPRAGKNIGEDSVGIGRDGMNFLFLHMQSLR